jgi:esterase/lipase superfamily enzyme
MKREHVSWWSPSVNRQMEFLWFGDWGRPLILFPTSGGRFFENEDFGLVGALADKVNGGQLQIICPDSLDQESWYNKWAHPYDKIRRHEQYDGYLRNELVPYIANRAQRSDLIVYGASFGAFHAANFAGRHPDVVRRAICFSGKYDIHSFLDGYWDDGAYFNCPTAYISNAEGESRDRLASVEWVVATGEHDSLVDDNRHFAGILAAKGIPHHAEIWPGQFGHDWPWWKEHLRRFVP